MITSRNPIRGLAAVSLLVWLVLALAGCGGGSKTSSEGTTAAPPATTGEVGSQAPPFALADLSGQTVSSTAFAGKVVILDFWATWCPPCRAEVPDFVALQEKYGSQGLEIVGLSLDAGGAKDVAPFVEEYKVNYKMLLHADEVAKAYGGITSIPTTFVIDRQGKIVQRFVGQMSREVFEASIAPLLAATS